MKPVIFRVTWSEFEALVALKVKHHRNWPVAFSANSHDDIWMFVTYGFTNERDRIAVTGQISFLDKLAQVYLDRRPNGGRFFVDQTGAFFQPENEPQQQFAVFKFFTAPPDRPTDTPILRRQNEAPSTYQRRLHANGMCDRDACRWCAEDVEKSLGGKKRRERESMADFILGEDRPKWRRPRWKR